MENFAFARFSLLRQVRWEATSPARFSINGFASLLVISFRVCPLVQNTHHHKDACMRACMVVQPYADRCWLQMKCSMGVAP